VRLGIVAFVLLAGCTQYQPATPNHVLAIAADGSVRAAAPGLRLTAGDHVVVARSYCYRRGRCLYETVGSGVVALLAMNDQVIIHLDAASDVEPGDRVFAAVSP
jgi:hypothetical protein